MIRIFKADDSDIKLIADFQVAMARETEDMDLNLETVLRGVGSVFIDPAKGFYLVAKEDGQTLGSLMITYEWSDWRAMRVWWIQSLYVVPERRRQGIFRRMFAWLEEEMDRDGSIGGIRLYVDQTNMSAQKVYESLGMDGNHYRFYEKMK